MQSRLVPARHTLRDLITRSEEVICRNPIRRHLTKSRATRKLARNGLGEISGDVREADLWLVGRGGAIGVAHSRLSYLAP